MESRERKGEGSVLTVCLPTRIHLFSSHITHGLPAAAPFYTGHDGSLTITMFSRGLLLLQIYTSPKGICANMLDESGVPRLTSKRLTGLVSMWVINTKATGEDFGVKCEMTEH